MKSTIRNLITFAFVCVVVVLCMTTSYAAEINTGLGDFGHQVVVKDYYGNEEVLAEYEVGDLESMPVSTFSYTADSSLPPAPYLVGREVPDLEQIIMDMQIPGGASFVFIDYGPNWDSVVDDAGSNTHLSGRYVYVFYGLYDSSLGRPATGGYMYNTGHSSYTWSQGDTPETNVLTIEGPVAMLCWNEENNGVYQQSNTYDLSFVTGGSSELEFKGIVSINDSVNYSFYPKLVTFADVDMSYFDCGPYDVTDDMDDFAWDNSWDGTIQHPDNENDYNLWDFILNGDFTASDDPIVQFFANALVNLAHFVELLKQLPDKFSTFVSVVPPEFTEFLIVCFGLLLAAVLIKLCLNILKR